MKHNEIISKKQLVGTCIDSFDETGDCINLHLPWSNTSDFAVAEENANHLDKNQFLSVITIPKKLSNHKLEYLNCDGIFTLYDAETDIHYFFI